jgi:putative glycosyltransferase (TIGR04372 family)
MAHVKAENLSLAGLQQRELSVRELSRLKARAVAALEKLDFEQCVEVAIAVAISPCREDDIPRLEQKADTCIYLFVALLQGLGKLDEAVFWLRQRELFSQHIARAYIKSRRLRNRTKETVFAEFWSSNIGHTAQLGVFAKRNILEGKQDRRLSLVRPRTPGMANQCLIEHWRRYFQLVGDGDAMPFPRDKLRFVSRDIFLDCRVSGTETYFWQAWAEISRAWEEAGGGPLLELSEEEAERGKRAAAELGIPEGKWFVCLHVRSPGFKAYHEKLQEALNADVASYGMLIDAIIARGGIVVRMGDRSMPRMAPRQGLIDYAHSGHKSDWLDIFLCANCRFYVGTSSGLAYVPGLFDVPCVFTNWFPSGMRPLSGNDIFIPKLHWYAADSCLAPYEESLAPPLGHIHSLDSLRRLGVTLRHNTPEELRDVAIEMLDRLSHGSRYTAEDDRLQARFNAVALQARSFGNARIGRAFLNEHAGLLPREAR